MFDWMSKRGKNAWQFLFWFFLFTYIPVIPTYFLMSMKGLLGLLALVYVALSMFFIFKMYIRSEKLKKFEKNRKFCLKI